MLVDEENPASMDVEIGENQVQELRERVGDIIAAQLLQRPNEALIVELVSTQEAR